MTAETTGVLRQRVDEFLGLFFYGTLLRQVRQGRLTDSPYGFGGRGEEVFAAQLDQELAERMGRATHNNLGEAICRRLGGARGAGRTWRPSGRAVSSGSAGLGPRSAGGRYQASASMAGLVDLLG